MGEFGAAKQRPGRHPQRPCGPTLDPWSRTSQGKTGPPSFWDYVSRHPARPNPVCAAAAVLLDDSQLSNCSAFFGVLAHYQRKSIFLPIASINSYPLITKPRSRRAFWRRAGPKQAGTVMSFARGGAGARAVRFVPRDSLHTPPTAKSGAGAAAEHEQIISVVRRHSALARTSAPRRSTPMLDWWATPCATRATSK